MSQNAIGFNAKCELNFHVKSVHQGVITHRCRYCPYSTFYTAKLRHHMMEEQHFDKQAMAASGVTFKRVEPDERDPLAL